MNEMADVQERFWPIFINQERIISSMNGLSSASGSLILFVEFCITRFGFLSNSLPVYNPSDVWVIIFGVASLLLVGYFVRYFYLLIKARRERIRNEKLKLRLDKQDDGTISVK